MAAPRVLSGPVNRRALRRYGEFWQALNYVGFAVDEAAQLASKLADQPAISDEDGTSAAGWAAPTPEELRSAAAKAGEALHVIAAAAKKWEAELISREWRR